MNGELHAMKKVWLTKEKLIKTLEEKVTRRAGDKGMYESNKADAGEVSDMLPQSNSMSIAIAQSCILLLIARMGWPLQANLPKNWSYSFKYKL